MISRVWPSKVTMMWSGICGILESVGDDGEDCDDCDDGDDGEGDRDDELIVLVV
jgi:hypothetical protein